MRTGRLVLGAVLLLSGLVWVAQGLDLAFAPESFMTADRTWVVIGAATALSGVLLMGRARQDT